jgi:hypothetical protein
MARFTQSGTGDGSGIPGPQGSQGNPGADGAPGADGSDALWDYLGEYNGGLIYGAGAVVTALIYMNGTTDYVELYCLLSGGGSLTGSVNETYFQGNLVRAA